MPAGEVTLGLLVLAPVAGAAGIVASRRRPARAASVALLTLAGTIALALWAALEMPMAELPAWGDHLTPALAVAGLGRVMVVLVPTIAAPIVLYAASAMRQDPGLPRLLALLVGFVGAMELLVLAGDFLTLLVGWELVGACSWALIGYEWRDPARPRAALHAFITTRAGDLGLYLAAAATFAAARSLRFDALAGAGRPALDLVAGGVLLAAAAKSAQLPFSPWLFSAMAGPTPASALLHSATMVAAGAYLLARLAPALAPVGWLLPATAAIGLATALAGGLVASVQSDFKRALAASTSAQYGLMLVAVGAGFPAVAGVHLVTHAAFKALLFLSAGAAIHAAGTGDLDRLKLGRALPGVAALAGVGALALAAVPPLGGAFSKDQIVAAAAAGGPALAAGVLAAAFLSAFYAGRLQLLAFGPGGAPPLKRLPRAEVWSLVALAGLSVGLGILWLPDAARVVERVMENRLAAGEPWELLASLALITVAFGTCWALWKRGDLLGLGLAPRVREVLAAWFGIPGAAQAGVVAPALARARALAAFDDRVVDGGIRAATAIAALVSGVLARGAERSVDALVIAVGRVTEVLARWSHAVDDRAVDRAVEALARRLGALGQESRRLQTGLAHQYFVVLAAGALVVAAAAALGRLAEGR